MHYISIKEAALLISQDSSAILNLVHLVEDGNFPESYIKHYFKDGNWQVYIAEEFVKDYFFYKINEKTNFAVREDKTALAIMVAFVAMFSLIWYVGSSLANTHQKNIKLQTAIELQRKALDTAYAVILKDRSVKDNVFKANNIHLLDEIQNEASVNDVVSDTDLLFNNINPEKVAIE